MPRPASLLAVGLLAATTWSAMAVPPPASAPPQSPAATRPVTSLPTVPPRIAPLRPTTAPTGTVEPRTLRSGADLDGDGVAYPDDCDDQDGSRYPGAMEIANDRDEDCNPETIGTLDLDGDGYTDSRVSNRAHYAGQTGLDCDDTKAGIRPDAQELPNRLDDNCDGMVDNLLGEWWTPR